MLHIHVRDRFYSSPDLSQETIISKASLQVMICRTKPIQ